MIKPPSKVMLKMMAEHRKKRMKIAGVKEGSKFTINGKEYKKNDSRQHTGYMK